MTLEKAKLYKTARALIACAHFSKGEFVGIADAWQAPDGIIWFTIISSERGRLPYGVPYTQSQLSEFCL